MLIVKKKMVSSLTEKTKITKNETLLSLVERTELPECLYPYLAVSINSERFDDWSAIATPSDVVQISVIPGGGGDGKNPLAAIAMIALSVFSAGTLAPMLIGAQTAYLGVVNAAIMFVGSLAINALFPPPAPSRLSVGDSSGMLGIQGQSNSARIHSAIRSIYGEFRLAPDIAAEPYIVTSGNIQTLYGILDLGYGKVDVEDIRIGNTPWGNYKGVGYKLHQNYTDGDLGIYKNDNATEIFSTDIIGPANPLERTVIGDNTREIVIDITYPIGSYIIDDVGNSESLEVCFDVHFSPTSGSSGWQAVHLARSSHSVTFPNPYTDQIVFNDLYEHTPPPAGIYNRRYPGYGVITGGSAFSVRVNGGLELNWNRYDYKIIEPKPLVIDTQIRFNGVTYTVTSVTRTGDSTRILKRAINDWVDGSSITKEYVVTDNNYDIVFDKAIPSNDTKQYDSWGYIEIYSNLMESTEYRYSWHPQFESLSTFELTPPTLSELCLDSHYTQPFVLSLHYILPFDDEWQIKISKSVARQWTGKCTLTSIRSISLQKPLQFKVPHTVLEYRIIATNELKGSIDTLSMYCKRHIRYFNGIDWVEGITSNPAWIALDILTGISNPDPVPDSRVDLESFKAWALFCDSLSSQGDVKYKADFTLDGISTVYDRYKSVLASGRATHSTRENLFSVIYESFPTIPVQLFTTKNSWGFNADRTFAKIPHALRVSFIDPTAEWQQVDRIVYNNGYDEFNATYFENISLPLCTRSEQAWRDGRYYLAQGSLRQESMTITTDIENLAAERGDLVKLQYDVAKMGGTSTRITAISGSVVTIREPVQWVATPDYYLRIRKQDGTQLEIQVVSQSDAYTITLASDPFANVGDLVVFGEVDKVTDEFLIKSITPSKDLTATLTLIPIARDIETSDTGAIPEFAPPSIAQPVMIVPQCIAGARITVDLLFQNRMPVVDATLQWDSIGTEVAYEIYISENGNNDYEFLGKVNEAGDYNLWNKRSVFGKDYPTREVVRVKILPVNAWGMKPPIEACASVDFSAPEDLIAPGKPLFMAGNVNGDTMSLSWLPPVDKDVAGYVIKYTPDVDTASWSEATSQGSLIPYNATLVNLNARIGTYMMKTLDTSGNYSEDFSMVRTSVSQLSGFTSFTDVIEDPLFDGEKTNVEIVSGGLRLTKPSGLYYEYGTYDFSTVVDLGGVYKCYISSELITSIINDGIGVTLESEQEVVIQMRASSYNPSIQEWDDLPNLMADVDQLSQPNDSTWGGWMQVYAGYSSGRYFQFRAILVSNNTDITPNVTGLKVKIEMVNRSEGDNDVISNLTGITSVNFYHSFKDTPSIQITQDNMDNGDYYKIINKTNSGFDISFFNVASSQISAQFDWLCVGYGEEMPDTIPAINAGDEDPLTALPDAISFITSKEILK